MPRGHGKAAVDARGVKGGQHLLDLGAVGEGRGALQKHQAFRQGLLLVQHLQGMEQGGFRAGGVAGDGRRPSHDIGSVGLGRRGDGVVVGADHHLADAGAGLGRRHGSTDQGYASDGLQILPRDALGAPAAGIRARAPEMASIGEDSVPSLLPDESALRCSGDGLAGPPHGAGAAGSGPVAGGPPS